MRERKHDKEKDCQPLLHIMHNDTSKNPGFQYFDTLIVECDNGTYGNGCNRTCGHCANKTICYHVNGTCFEGCDPGYRGSRCHQGKLYSPEDF